MTRSKPRTRVRQRLRQQVADAVDPLAPRYVLEAMAKRLRLTNGWYEVRVRDGFVQFVRATHVQSLGERMYPPEWADPDHEEFREDYPELVREINDTIRESQTILRENLKREYFSPAQLLEREPKPAREKESDEER